jgi:hypothetical protein
VAERRHLALQEKNRRAQRRFRERQKVSSTSGVHRVWERAAVCSAIGRAGLLMEATSWAW